MEITEVKVFPVKEDRLKAYASITFDDCFVVRDLKVILGNSGLFVAMPSKKRKDGSFKDTAHPLNVETRNKIESMVLGVYFEEAKKKGIEVTVPVREMETDKEKKEKKEAVVGREGVAEHNT